jgi:hypothetical protein
MQGMLPRIVFLGIGVQSSEFVNLQAVEKYSVLRSMLNFVPGEE